MPPRKSFQTVFSDRELSWICSDGEISPELYFDKFRSGAENSHEEHQRYSRLLEKGGFTTPLLPTPAVSAGRSEGSPSFQETEYVNEDDEDGGHEVNLLSFDGMPVRLVSPGKNAASWSGSKRFVSPKWTAPSMLLTPFESSSRTGAPSIASAQFGKVIQSITRKTPAQSRETSKKNVVPSKRAFKMRKNPNVDGGSVKKTATGNNPAPFLPSVESYAGARPEVAATEEGIRG
ncbi:hypothetical protein BGZ82_011828 [Podila clonocystis]|nr:hypothetical protein BGZ82_011828 [Podila clonocystis]